MSKLRENIQNALAKEGVETYYKGCIPSPQGDYTTFGVTTTDRFKAKVLANIGRTTTGTIVWFALQQLWDKYAHDKEEEITRLASCVARPVPTLPAPEPRSRD